MAPFATALAALLIRIMYCLPTVSDCVGNEHALENPVKYSSGHQIASAVQLKTHTCVVLGICPHFYGEHTKLM